MSNICLNVTLRKNWRSQNFHFLILKFLSQGQLDSPYFILVAT